VEARAKFTPGRVVATQGALEALAANGGEAKAIELLRRHLTGDWGDLDDHDRRQNEYALVNYVRLLSAYTLGDGTKIWIITEADRSSTTYLLPEEY
jgi:hypothetical protein